MVELSEAFKATLIEAAKALRGPPRRVFMARTVRALGEGGQRRAESELGWSRVTIRKGEHELASGITCLDNYSARGRKPVEVRLPSLFDDIRDLVHDQLQTDPTFQTTRLYCRISAADATASRSDCPDFWTTSGTSSPARAKPTRVSAPCGCIPG